MEEIIYSNIQDNTFENARHEILCEDIIRKVRPAIEQYAFELRRFVRESMFRGFDRSMIKHSIIVFQSEIMSLITMAENSLVMSNSPKAKILESELQALRISIEVFVRTSENVILEKPNANDQLFGDIGRIG